MEENLNPIPEPVPEYPYLARGREFAFVGIILLLSILMCNFVFYGGFHLAFGLVAAAVIVTSWLYLRKSGYRFGWYEKTLLILSLIICLGFGRSDDGFVKFVMLLFLFGAVNLALCIAAGQNRRNPDGAMSLLDAYRAFFRLGMGNMGRAGVGLKDGVKRGGATTRRMGAVGIGLLISLPILAVMILLLISADAAFEGLMDLLPDFELGEYLRSAFWGTGLAWVLYSRGISLAKEAKPLGVWKYRKGINALTVNTVLTMVCLVYAAYLLSQLAYLSGGLSGILPEGYTLAEYARRGFFEMAWLCTINLGLISGCIWLIREETLPRMTKIAGTFLGAVTIFLILTASAKMFLYIDSYGLTRMRVLTEVTMLWLALTTVLVTVRLYRPGFGYMKAVILTAMTLGTLVFWADVNTVVAGYNVRAYQSGKLETVDVAHIGDLGSAGVPWLLELMEAEDPQVADQARNVLDDKREYRGYDRIEDFRGWNYNAARGEGEMTLYQEAINNRIYGYLTERLGLELDMGTVLMEQGVLYGPENGKQFLKIQLTQEEAEVLELRLEEAGWQPLPMDKLVELALSDGKDLFREFRNHYAIPEGQPGWWYFRDLYPGGEAGENIHKRDGYRFVLAWYDMEARRLYYFETDTLQTGKTA